MNDKRKPSKKSPKSDERKPAEGQRELFDTQVPGCPRCGKPMVLRTNSRSGAKFWGCSQFARGACRGTLPYIAPTPGGNYKCPSTVRRIAKPSSYQQAIFDELLAGKRHMVVDAVAGSGKTTTMVEGLIRLYESGYKGTSLFLAYNTAIRDEISERIDKAGLQVQVEVRTTHSLGFAVARRQWRTQIDERKVEAFLDRAGIVGRQPDGQFNAAKAQLRTETLDAVGLAKNTLTRDVQQLAAYYGKDWSHADLQPTVDSVLEFCGSNLETCDFDDMLWLAATQTCKLPKYDRIFVDEAQDLNAAQHALLRKLIEANPNAKVCGVGDPHQAIYGFRGALNDSMARLRDVLPGHVLLPLSVTYRCPRTHVAMARQLVTHLQAADHAIEGIIEYGTREVSDKMVAEDLVVCRTNAPLISYAYALLKRNQKAIIRGRDFGASVRALIKKLKAYTIPQLIQNIRVYRAKQAELLQERPDALQAMHDTCDAIEALSDGHDKLESMLQQIDNLFSDTNEKNAVVLSTVHRAKGLEANTVYIINYDRIELPSRTAWGQDQERNLHYVALTRAKQKLVLIAEDPREEAV